VNTQEKELLAHQAGICRLCEKPAELRKSHILPNLAYSEVIETSSHPRMVVVRNSQDGPITDKSHQTGFRERLLCENCEGQFSEYEVYASNNLLNLTLPLPQSARDLLNTIQVSDYAKLKLFLISLLWRVGVARHDFFGCVDLGPHAARLREMLYAEDPGEPDEYGCLITRLLPEKHILVDRLLATPHSTRIFGHHGCLIYFRGFVFHYYVSSHNIPADVRQAFVNKNGQLLIMWMRLEMIPPLRDMWRRCVVASRQSKS
jgi:hypothetical protein